MHTRLLRLLACPRCGVGVSLEEAGHGGHDRIESGRLRCPRCRATYPIVAGIPRFAPDVERGRPSQKGPAQTVAHFVREFTAYAEGDADIGDLGDVEREFYERTGIGTARDTRAEDRRPDSSRRPAFLTGKTVLDAGCGPGRFTQVAARSAAHVVALELGNHVERAAARCRDLPNVDFVQGSVLEPPLFPETFDFVFSLGVVHHTPDAKKACLQLARLVSPTGAMSVWVYPPEYWGRSVQRPVGRGLHRVLSRLPPDQALRICERCLYPLGRLQMQLSRRRWTRVLGAPLFVLGVPRHADRHVMIVTIYDHFGPSLISTHTFEEVEEWLREAGFTQLRRGFVPTGWLAERTAVERGGCLL